jgi:iron complex outermembrane recepter protein
MRRSLFLVMLAGPASVSAQDTLARRDTVVLAPTVVTVTRTPVELSRAPFAIAAAGRDELQRGRIGLALDETLTGIPGVQVDNRFNYALGERISIRGLGARAQFGVRGVRVLLDGIPMTLADGQTALNNVDAGDIARAEVIRGPASALHGNAAAGVIQLESELGDDSGTELRTDLGADGLLRYQLGARHASERQFGAISASHLGYDGYRDWNTAKNDRVNFRVGRYLTVGELALQGNWVEYDADNPGALPRDSARLKPRMAWPANKNTFMTGETGRQWQLGASWKQSVGPTDLQLTAHGLERHVDNPIPQRIVVVDRNAGGARLSLSPRSAVLRVRTSVGAELQSQRDDRKNFVNSAGSRGATTLDQLENVLNSAVFAQGVLDVAPRLLAMAGLRYDRIRFRASDRLVSPTNPDDSGERTMSALNPSLGATWSAGSGVDVYANYSTSFETPTTSELANQESGAGGINQALDPQRTRSVEIGAKGRLPARLRGTYQLAVYDARVTDALIPFEVPAAPGRQYFRNAGSTTHRGVETAATVALPRKLSLRAQYTHTDARFEHYVVTSGTTTTVFDGKRVPGVAANRADATLSFQPRNVFVDFEARFSSSVPVNDANSERSAGYEVYSLRAGLRDYRSGRLALTPHVGVLNLTDKAYNTSVVINAFGGRYYEPGPPRSLYAGLRARF